MTKKPRPAPQLEKKGYTAPPPKPLKVNGGYQGTGHTTNETKPPSGGGGGSQSSGGKK